MNEQSFESEPATDLVQPSLMQRSVEVESVDMIQVFSTIVS